MLANINYAASQSSEVDIGSLQWKFDPQLWERVQALKSNGTIINMSLIIWLGEP